ncbi:MAG: endonuclease domain-containing protein [Alphaproteobacteria bacterium]|nr:endonuclease domain-containing protein [Alphaproteobacteria bacterium]MBV9371528.1 endonuclease domain-containing protein [Alphaproteobacteria bacterium]MBV9902730.1 endonuclease domain-containing protein [Alphaproteobacteria bacterium]
MRDQLLLERAKRMRREQTAPEQRLWLELRAKRFAGAKFRRQVVIDGYIVDFARRTPRMLIVEVDGDTHAGREHYDAARSAELERRGYKVMRFTNDDVRGNMDGVLTRIASPLEGLPLSPALSPDGERA